MLIVLLVACGVGVSSDEDDRLVGDWVEHVLASDRATLRDYWRFEGRQEGQELRLELAHCRRMGWTPELSNPRCIEFTRKRHETPERVESLYLRCIRTMWSGSANVGPITPVKTPASELPSGAALVDVEIGKHKVRFLHSAGALSEEIGELALISLDGRPPSVFLADPATPEECRVEPE